MDRYTILKWLNADGDLSFIGDKDNKTIIFDSYHQAQRYVDEFALAIDPESNFKIVELQDNSTGGRRSE